MTYEECNPKIELGIARRRIKELEEELADRDEAYATVIEERCPSDERHCACVPHLRQRIKELEAEGGPGRHE